MTVLERLEPLKPQIIKDYMDKIPTGEICKKYDANHKFIYNIIKDSGVQRRGVHGKADAQQDRILELFDSGITIYKIGQQLNLPETTLQRVLQKWGRDTSKYSDHREIKLNTFADEIISYYNSGIGCTTLSKKYKCNESSIRELLIHNGIDTTFVPKHECDYSFFEKIDSEEKAWVLGVWVTDGNNGDDYIRVSMTDYDIIEKMKKVMRFSGPIGVRKLCGKMKKVQHILCISGQKMSKDLTNCGCGPNKTFTVKFPNEQIVQKDLQKHFIRGMIDGDGTINTGHIGLCGASPMIPQFQHIIESRFNGIEFKKYDRPNTHEGVFYNRRLQNIKDACLFLHWIYDDATIYGQRKFDNAHRYWFSREAV